MSLGKDVSGRASSTDEGLVGQRGNGRFLELELRRGVRGKPGQNVSLSAGCTFVRHQGAPGARGRQGTGADRKTYQNGPGHLKRNLASLKNHETLSQNSQMVSFHINETKKKCKHLTIPVSSRTWKVTSTLQWGFAGLIWGVKITLKTTVTPGGVSCADTLAIMSSGRTLG